MNSDAWQDGFGIRKLLNAMDDLDTLRAALADDGLPPSELRTRLLRLHGLAVAVVNDGSQHQTTRTFDLATELEDMAADIWKPLPGCTKSSAPLPPCTLIASSHSSIEPIFPVHQVQHHGDGPKGIKVEQPKAGHKPNALQQPLRPSPELAAIVGEGTMARSEVVSRVWEYIKAHKLQSPDDGWVIVADGKLRQVFGKGQTTMFEMNKLLAQHLK